MLELIRRVKVAIKYSRIYLHYEGKAKSSSLAYNRRETWDKRVG